MPDNFAIVKADGVEGAIGIAGGVDPAGVGIIEKEVVPAVEDEGGFLPALGEGQGARGGDLNLGLGPGFRGGVALLRFWPRLGSGEKLRRVFGVRWVVHGTY